MRFSYTLQHALRIAALGALALLARAETVAIRYEEPVNVEWGPVIFETEFDGPVTQSMWFTRTKPTFTAGQGLKPAESAYLADKFQACAVTTGDGHAAWGLANDKLEGFLEKVTGDPLPGLSVTGYEAPAEWAEGGPTSQTTRLVLRLQANRATPSRPPPQMEILLQVEGVPARTAWRVNLPTALASAKVAGYGDRFTEEQARAISAAASWAQIYLVPANFSTDDLPVTVVDLPDLEAHAVPVAFGLHALAEAAGRLDAKRSPSDANYENLAAGLSPDRASAFPGAYRWFPEPAASRNELPNFLNQTGTSAAALVTIVSPPVGRPTGGENRLRVRPLANQWVIRCGPFRALKSPTVSVTGVRGKTRIYTLPELRTELAGKPEALSANLANVAELERRLTKTLDKVTQGEAGRALVDAGYFWLPAVAAFNQAAARALESERYTTAIAPAMGDGGLTYRALFKPASAKGKVGLAYDSHAQLGLTAKLEGAGLFDPRDTLSLSAKAADRELSGTLEYKDPYLQERGREQELEVSGRAGRDDQFALGRLGTFVHRSQNAAVEHRWLWEPPSRNLTLALGAAWDAHDLRPVAGPGRLKDHGLVIRPRARGEINTGTWKLVAAVRADVAPAVGWDRSFWQGEGRLQARYSWGGDADAAQTMYLSVVTEGGAGSTQRPAATWYRLGEDERLPGLEPGEFSGTRFLRTQLLYGVQLSHLLRRLFTSSDPAKPAEIPPALQMSSLELFADAGRVNDLDRTLVSYGIALKSMTASPDGSAGLQLGYAWSPDSRKHKGRVFTALDWKF